MITVIGGGTMGSGIAVSFLAIGESVTVVETVDGAEAAVNERVRSSLERMARKSDIDVDETMGRLVVAGAHAPTDDVVLVVEAIPEDLILKQQLFAVVEDTYPTTALLATNTSSLSITSIAENLDDPGRLLGMHFFNPVPVSELVEIVKGAETRPDMVDSAHSWAQTLGKTPIIVDDAPGFASSRLGVALGLEAIRMLEEGVASAEDIDTAMQLGYKHPMGPLKLTDLVGVDVRLAVAEYLARELGPRFEPPQLMRDKVAAGELGKKTGRGFYDW